jgi:exosortase
MPASPTQVSKTASIPDQVGSALRGNMEKISASASIDSIFLTVFGILSLLLIICYWNTIVFTGNVLISSEDMAHGFFAPIVALMIVAFQWNTVVRSTGSPSWFALPVLVLSGLLGIAATIAMSATFGRLALLGSLAGLVLLAGGWSLLRALLFPLALLLYTFPIPVVLYGEITLPMQLLATRLSEFSLEALGFSVLREGNVLLLPHQRLSVVEACSGIRSLVTLSFFCLVYAYLAERRNRVRALLFAASIPAAIFVNMVRITVTGVLGEYRPELTKGFAHDLLGWSVFFLGFGLVVALHHMLKGARTPQARAKA